MESCVCSFGVARARRKLRDVKLPEKLPPVPRLTLESARWTAVCGNCLARSRIVTALTEREAWNEIASTEGWCVYEPGEGFEPYPLCLACVTGAIHRGSGENRRAR